MISMSDTRTVQELIDAFLASTAQRTLIPVGEVQDFVLDLRNLLGAA